MEHDDVLEHMTDDEIDRFSEGLGLPKPKPPITVSPLAFADKVAELHKHGIQRGVSPGWLTVAEHWTLRPGDWTLITGIPSHGKSAFLNAVMVNTARHHDWNWLVWSAENLPQEIHIAELLELYHGKPFGNGYYARMEPAAVQEGLEWLDRHFRFLAPPEDDETVEKIIECAQASNGWAKGLTIDPWNELHHPWSEQRMSETEYISRALKKLRRHGRDAGVHVVVVAHPKMLQKDKDGKYPIPTPYDVAGSAHWRNKADCALTVWRDEAQPGFTTIYVQKIRRKAVGKIGAVEMKFDVVTGRFSEYMREPGSDDE